MITYWQQTHQKLVRVKKEDLNPQLKTWVDVRSVTPSEVSQLESEFNIVDKNNENQDLLTNYFIPLDSDDIYKEIYEKGFLKNSKMTIKYYGNKNQFQINDSQKKLDNQEIEKNEINKEDPRNSLLFIEYE